MSLSSFIWSVADLLRGDYKQSQYGRVILPFTVLRRLDSVLEPSKAAVLAEHKARKQAGINPEPFLLRKAQQSFYNTSPMDMKTLMGDQDHIKENLYAYMQAFSLAVRDIFERFDFYVQIDRLAKCGFPDEVSNTEMGTISLTSEIRRSIRLENS
jgi:type I restriction enzyme M protein